MRLLVSSPPRAPPGPVSTPAQVSPPNAPHSNVIFMQKPVPFRDDRSSEIATSDRLFFYSVAVCRGRILFPRDKRPARSGFVARVRPAAAAAPMMPHCVARLPPVAMCRVGVSRDPSFHHSKYATTSNKRPRLKLICSALTLKLSSSPAERMAGRRVAVSLS
ncbi:hypothetical protein EVAR_23516_1 [Eumeta japonica]|uniref:Uncharacterized protein n=1 Tax=Eumeta variegata TaxID=151549 RepID=A0A4C1W3B3_EUMVA|nr:hypothetical protein EVAR_23516_1 [Eumeta japonica]